MTVQTTPAPALPADLELVLRRMRMSYLRAAAPDVLATAKAQRWDPAEVLRVLISEEIRGRDEATRRARRKIAGLPAGEAFYRVVEAAYERRSVAVTSNLHPSGFDTIMPKTLATAAVDRLLHHAHVVVTEGTSLRLTDATSGKGVIPLNLK